MNQEPSTEALSAAEIAKLRNDIEAARTPGRRLSVQMHDAVEWLTWRSLARFLATLDRESEVRSDLARQVADAKAYIAWLPAATCGEPLHVLSFEALTAIGKIEDAILAGTDATPTDRLYFGAGPKVTPDPVWSCLGCGRATNHFVTGSLVHPEIGLCERCVTAIRAGTDATPEPPKGNCEECRLQRPGAWRPHSEHCSCRGRRWVEDENSYNPDRKERTPGDGLIPCGFCNEAGWETSEWAPETANA